MLQNNSIQRDSGDNWQSLFIRENFLSLGHIAWQGFIAQGQGIVVCLLTDEDLESINWSLDLVEYESYFLRKSEVTIYLQLLGLKQAEITLLTDRVHNYNPETEILLMVKENSDINILLLQNMAVAPPKCYKQVQQRESEFQLTISPPGEIYQ